MAVSIKIILRKDKINNKGEAPLFLRVITYYKVRFLSLKISIKPSDWDSNNNKVRKSHPNSARLNAYLAEKFAEAYNIVLEADTKKQFLSGYQIRDVVMGKRSSDFFEYADKYVASVETEGRIGYYKRTRSVIKKLKEYRKNKKLYFEEITVGFLKNYEEHLRIKYHNKTNTITANLKLIRKIINDAIAEDIIPVNSNPFLRYHMKNEPTKKEFLDEDELLRIENLILSNDSMLFHHRNAFVFATYAGGLRISDVLQLKWENFDGKRLYIKMQKTKTPHSVMLPKKALDILALYKTHESIPNHYIFPFLKNDMDTNNPNTHHDSINSAASYVNKDLKIIAKKAGISKHITSHTSRHTFATLALRKGIGMEYVSKLLGHRNIRITQDYAKIVDLDLEQKMAVFNN